VLPGAVVVPTRPCDGRLENGSTIREAFYEMDGDATSRFFLGMLSAPAGFRDLIVTERGLLNAAFPDRYKRFIVAGDLSHTAVQNSLFSRSGQPRPRIERQTGCRLSGLTRDKAERSRLA
jgi:hypothetical protein